MNCIVHATSVLSHHCAKSSVPLAIAAVIVDAANILMSLDNGTLHDCLHLLQWEVAAAALSMDAWRSLSLHVHCSMLQLQLQSQVHCESHKLICHSAHQRDRPFKSTSMAISRHNMEVQ